MKIHIVEALRFGDRENHSYVVGVYTDPEKAKEVAQAEEHWRGGKYECEIKEVELDAVDKDVMAQWEKDREFIMGYQHIPSSMTLDAVVSKREQQFIRNMIEMKIKESKAAEDIEKLK